MLGLGVSGAAAGLELRPDDLAVFIEPVAIPLPEPIGVTEPIESSEPITTAEPVTCVLTASADGSVEEAAPGASHGSDPVLEVRPDAGRVSRAFVRFDLSTCPGLSNATVVSATLDLFLLELAASFPGSGATSYQVTAVQGPWSEETLTWDTRPAVASSATAAAPQPDEGGPVSWDVWADVQAAAHGAPHEGWQFSDAQEGRGSGGGRLAAREYPATSWLPTLTVTYHPGA
jgi:hypothetical protein